MLKLLLWGALIAIVVSEQVRYDNYKLFKVHVDSDEQYEILKELQKGKWSSVNFWNEIHHIGDNCDIMVPPGVIAKFEDFLQRSMIRYELMMEDVQAVIDSQNPKTRSSAMEWTEYHTLDEIYAWLDEISAKYPKIITPFSIGKSFEGRSIRGIKISFKAGNKAVFIESNIHAREWITSASITWVIDQFLHSRRAAVRDIADNLDWYIIPVLNTDGFVYSHEVNRMWRKTRQPNGHPDCVGTDMNRNFDFLWNMVGTSDDPCSEIYAGPSALSEPEIANLVKYFDTIPEDYVKIYISLHSYGQYVLSPWGHTDTEFPENYDDMMAVAKGFADGYIRENGTVFTYGSSSTTLYKVSGSGKEWAYGVKGIPIPYTIELRDTGEFGFILPPKYILVSSKEVLDGFIGMVHAARERKIVPERN